MKRCSCKPKHASEAFEGPLFNGFKALLAMLAAIQATGPELLPTVCHDLCTQLRCKPRKCKTRLHTQFLPVANFVASEQTAWQRHGASSTPMEGIRLLAKLQPFMVAWGALHDNEIAPIPEDSLEGYVFYAVDLIFPHIIVCIYPASSSPSRPSQFISLK